MNKNNFIYLFIFISLSLAFFSLTKGSYYIEPSNIFWIILSKFVNVKNSWSDQEYLVLLDVRLPRILLVIFIGTNLSVSGAILQSIFKNPLVSPSTLGITSGASFGASLIILLFQTYNPYILQSFAFIFGILSILIVLSIARIFNKKNIVIILLAGVIISSFFIALTSLIQFFSTEDKLQAILFWTFGSFSNSTWNNVFLVMPITILGLLILILLAFRIDILSLGDDEAEALGLNVIKLRIFIVLIVSLLTGTAVAVSGPIGWVGLIIPHIARLLIGSNSRKIILCSIFLGSSFLLLVDLISRTIFKVEIPAGIVTSIIGVPFFIFTLYNTRKNL